MLLTNVQRVVSANIRSTSRTFYCIWRIKILLIQSYSHAFPYKYTLPLRFSYTNSFPCHMLTPFLEKRNSQGTLKSFRLIQVSLGPKLVFMLPFSCHFDLIYILSMVGLEIVLSLKEIGFQRNYKITLRFYDPSH